MRGLSDINIRVQQFNASGSPVRPAQDIGPIFDYTNRVAGLGDGGYAVFTGTQPQPHFWRFDGGGRLVASFTVPEPGAGVSGLVGGGYALGREVFFGAPSGSVQRFSANGAPVGSAIPFNAVAAIFAGFPDVAGTADGAAIGVGGNLDSVAAAKDGGYAIAYSSRTGTDNQFVNLRILARQAVPSTAGPVSGEAGASASFATAPGVAQVTGGTPPTDPGTTPTTPGTTPPPTPPPVVSGRASGGARFDGIAGCDFTCAEAARNLQAAVDAMIIADANRAGVDAMIRADANRAAVDAMIAAEANRAAVDALISDDANRARAAAAAHRAAVDAESAGVDALLSDDANKARAVAAAQRAAQNVTGKPGGAIDEAKAAAAVRELQRATGRLANEAFASSAAILLLDQGEFNRLVRGNRFDRMTPEQRMQALERWLEAEGRVQAAEILTEGANVPRANIIRYNEMIGNGTDAERRAVVDDLARRQAAGEVF